MIKIGTTIKTTITGLGLMFSQTSRGPGRRAGLIMHIASGKLSETLDRLQPQIPGSCRHTITSF